MHVLIAFVIGIAIFNSFYTVDPVPKGEWSFETSMGSSVTSKHSIKPLSEFLTERLIRQQYEYSCGSASLATILKYYIGEDFTEKEVIHGMLEYGDVERIKRRRAFSLLDMKKFVNVLGYQANGYKGSIEDLQDSDFWPCIVPITFFSYKHFVVVKGVHRGHIFVVDPWTGHNSYTLGQFEEIWFQNVMFVISSDNRKPRNALRLNANDLRFIDEDTAYAIMYEQVIETPLLDIDRGLEEVPYVRQYYKP